MVPIDLSINLYELKEKIKKEIIDRLMNTEVYNYPLDSAWLLYALFLDKTDDNPYFRQGINKLRRWALSKESGKKEKDLAPLSFYGFLSMGQEIKEEVIKKVKDILEKALRKLNVMQFNVLNDPEQVFCASLLLKNDENVKKSIVDIAKRNINGRASRKVFFIASLIECGENVQSFLSLLNTPESPEGIIFLLWLAERYRKFIELDLVKLWKYFESIYPSLDLVAIEKSQTISNRNLVLLYEAVTIETNEPNPNMIFDLYPFNSEIRMIAKDHFKNKKYVNAVFEATKKLNELIQNKTGIKNKNEVELVQATMKQIGNPKQLPIVFNDYISEDSGKNEQKGLALITEGIFTAFRNPKGHKPEDHPLVNMTAYEALSQLIIIDYIWKRIKNAKTNPKDSKNT